MRLFVLLNVLIGLNTLSFAQADSLQNIDLQQVTVTATMATARTPMTFTNINNEQIRRKDNGQDIPFLLKNTPSVVETSDAGAGIGYTGIRIRGSDATRTNITIDGIPLNDSESQLVYWVNMPDFASSTSMIQIQRGAGTSTNGAGAFGASINLITNPLRSEKYLNYTGGFGSFNTQRHSFSAGSGLIGKHWTFDGRASLIKSDGYVDRAASDLKSLFFSTTYLNKNTSIKAKVFTGKEITYQSWYGIPYSYLNDSKLRTYNPAGTEKTDTPYDNQVDNYSQTHAHITANHQFSAQLRGQVSLHYTRGKGYYEEYKAKQKFTDYRICNFIVSGSDTIIKQDLVRRLWLDNHFYGAVYSLHFDNKKIQNILGGGLNNYSGKHYGTLPWIDQPNPLQLKDFISPFKFYESKADKWDFNIFNKLNYAFTPQLNGYLDVQYRNIAYKTAGFDRKQRNIAREVDYHFFNPKMGLTFELPDKSLLYASGAIAHREPNRNDLTDAELSNMPKTEKMFDTEIGWRGQYSKGQFGVNLYSMYYDNQLVITGNINDVGEQIRVNVPKSYRIGLEMDGEVSVTEGVSLTGNMTLSQNKIDNFTEFRDNWDTGVQDKITHGKTDLALSPNIIVNSAIRYQILRGDKNNWDIAISGKYIGKQFIDNTANANTQLPAFGYLDFLTTYKTSFKYFKNITCKLLINNILNKKYVNNAWTYRFASPNYDPRPDDPYARSEGGNVYHLSGFFPQAGRHFIVTFGIDF
jgi:iron complex outermembrane receptor protein